MEFLPALTECHICGAHRYANAYLRLLKGEPTICQKCLAEKLGIKAEWKQEALEFIAWKKHEAEEKQRRKAERKEWWRIIYNP